MKTIVTNAGTFEVRASGVTFRGFCPTGPGGGIDNSCGRGGSGGSMAPDTGGSFGGEGASNEPPRNDDGTKVKNVFPKITGKSGGFTAAIRFDDEQRGERHFDSTFSIWNHTKPGEFRIGNKMAGRGDSYSDVTAEESLGNDLRAGDVVSVAPIKWTPRGRTDITPSRIKVTEVVKDGGYLHVKYKNHKT